MPPTRETDHGQLGGKEPIVKITREIPMVWILSVLGLGAATAAGMFYGILAVGKEQSALNVKQTEIGAKVESINEKMNQAAVVGAEVKFKLDDLSRRVTVLEASGKAGK